jgi:hypothetical protein
MKSSRDFMVNSIVLFHYDRHYYYLVYVSPDPSTFRTFGSTPHCITSLPEAATQPLIGVVTIRSYLLSYEMIISFFSMAALSLTNES